MSLSLSMSSVMADAITASGLTADKLSLATLQSKMKCDPDSYETEVQLIYKQFNSSLELFQEQAALSFNSLSGISNDPKLAKELGDKAMFLAHMRPVYPQYLANFPKQLGDLLHNTARSLPSFLRLHLAQALILLANKKIISIADTLPLFMELQTLGDKNLRKLLSSHVVNSIKRMNQKHKNDPENRELKKILFEMLQRDEESIAKRSLNVLCELHRRKVWFDDTTANALCLACFHPSSKIMVATLSFLLDFDKLEDDDDSDASSEDEATPDPQVILNKEAIYKAHHKGTTASKKKKQAKLQRVIRNMKRKQRANTEDRGSNNYSPLKHLKDAQGFAEKLFSRLQSCNERFEVKMMMLKVIARTVGLHSLILLNFYPYLQKYVQPHQREVTALLAAAIEACHEMVPPDAVEPLFKQIVNQFVHDRSREEAITVGLNSVREICLRMPLLMTEELLQDLVQYRKSHGKAVSIAARSLMYLFREVCPSLLTKKDRGRPIDPKAKPKAYGEVNVETNVPGIELLQQDDEDSDDNCGSDDQDSDDDSVIKDYQGCSSDGQNDDNNALGDSGDDTEADTDSEEDDLEVNSEEDGSEASGSDMEDEEESDDADEADDVESGAPDFEGQLNAGEASLRALKKRLTDGKRKHTSIESTEEIISDEQHQKIKRLKANKKAEVALRQQGLVKKGSESKSASASAAKILSPDQLSRKAVNPDKLNAYTRKKMTKDERMALVKAGREDRGKYQARTAVKQKKTGGLSNSQKEHKKKMPLAAKRHKIKKNRQVKKRKQSCADKQFRGRKAWK